MSSIAIFRQQYSNQISPTAQTLTVRHTIRWRKPICLSNPLSAETDQNWTDLQHPHFYYSAL